MRFFTAYAYCQRQCTREASSAYGYEVFRAGFYFKFVREPAVCVYRTPRRAFFVAAYSCGGSVDNQRIAEIDFFFYGVTFVGSSADYEIQTVFGFKFFGGKTFLYFAYEFRVRSKWSFDGKRLPCFFDVCESSCRRFYADRRAKSALQPSASSGLKSSAFARVVKKPSPSFLTSSEYFSRAIPKSS